MHRGLAILGIVAVGVTGIGVSTAFPSTPPDEPASGCTADDGKAFAPELTAADICARFTRALGDQAAQLRVSLSFSRRGLAAARVLHRRGDRWESLPLFELMVIDRLFNLSDIDRLAQIVSDGVTTSSPTGEA